MKRVFALTILLAACGQAKDSTADLRERVRQQQTRIDEQDAEIASLKEWQTKNAGEIKELYDDVQFLKGMNDNTTSYLSSLGRENDAQSKQISDNAKAANENAVADMTRRGACGTELITHPNGAIENRKIPCTLDDLKK